MLVIALFVLAALVVFIALIAVSLRRVVATNEVHIVQSAKHTVSYGKGEEAGNVYYQWPSWIPVIGLTRRVLPTSIFSINLHGYDAYDKDRVPFVVDVVAFFRIHDSNTAAQRVEDFHELEQQLTAIVQGAVRTTLASHDIDSIMVERSKFGVQFTDEVQEQLKGWGAETVKNIELMDVHDAKDSKVVHNIMAKRISHIEMESRTQVASNVKNASIAEIDAAQEVGVRKQHADQIVGQRTAEKNQAVGVANEVSNQQVIEQQRITKTVEMSVVQVENVRRAEITREVQIVQAEQQRQTTVIAAEAAQAATVLTATGALEAKKREAEGLQVEGLAKAAAETAILQAPVTAQLTLAREIGTNLGYQNYLLGQRQIEAAETVGVAQAGALKNADIKVITNSGTPAEGLSNVMDLFSSKGGTALASMVEGFSQSKVGKQLVETVTGEDG